MNQLKKPRINSLDVAKGLAIIFVVAGHTMYYGYIHSVIYSVSIRMPMFFMISGMFVNPQKHGNFAGYLKNKLKTLICPYVLFAFIGIAVHLLLNLLTGGTMLTEGPLNYLLKSLLTIVWAPNSPHFHDINTPLWFVPCLFLIELMYYFLAKIKNKKVFCAVVVLIVMFGWFTESKYCPVDLSFMPWNFCSACFALGFFVSGKLIYNFIKEKILLLPSNAKNNLKLAGVFVLLTVVSVAFAAVNKFVSMGSRVLKNGFIFYIVGISGALAIIIFAKFVEKSRFLQFCGKNSFSIMGIHVLLDNIFVVAFEKISSVTNISILNLAEKTLFSAIARFVLSAVFAIIFAFFYAKVKNAILKKRTNSLEKA